MFYIQRSPNEDLMEPLVLLAVDHHLKCTNLMLKYLYVFDTHSGVGHLSESRVTWLSSSSLATASLMCRGVILPFLLSRAAFPANSRISAKRTENSRKPSDKLWVFLHLNVFTSSGWVRLPGAGRGLLQQWCVHTLSRNSRPPLLSKISFTSL